MTRKIPLCALVPALAIGLSACGSSNSGAGASSSSSMSSTMPMPSHSNSTSSTQPPASASAEAAGAVISIADFAFTVPVSVRPGATITVKNADTEAHTVTSKDGGFDVKVDPDGTATLRAPTKPGRYPFVCSFHADMTGILVVQ